MTHVVVWIDHKEARIFRVHPEAADESRILSPQHPSAPSEFRCRRLQNLVGQRGIVDGA